MNCEKYIYVGAKKYNNNWTYCKKKLFSTKIVHATDAFTKADKSDNQKNNVVLLLFKWHLCHS